jgi:predicted nucleic acid-binding Zn ribbon protein
MSYRRSPRPMAGALGHLADELAPATVLARVQRVWPGLVGTGIADQARPVSERAGTLTVACAASVWAQELDLMGPDILARLARELPGVTITRLRCVTSRR